MTWRWSPIDAGSGLVGASRPALGTSAQVVMPAGAALEASLQGLDQADHAANRFRPESEMSRLNYARAGERELGRRLADLLQAALLWARRTHGLVDPTVGAASGRRLGGGIADVDKLVSGVPGLPAVSEPA